MIKKKGTLSKTRYKPYVLLGLLTLSVFLTGCSEGTKEEKEAVQFRKESKMFLNSYDSSGLGIDDYIYEDKSEEELKEEIVRNLLGIRELDERYRKKGFVSDQGTFIESGILKGGTIPTTTTLKYSAGDNEDKIRAENSKKLEIQKELDTLLLDNYRNYESTEINEEDVVEEINKQLAKRKENIGKERSYSDLNTWQFNNQIEKKYVKELTDIRKTILAKEELEQAKNRVKELRNQVKDTEKLQELEKQIAENDKKNSELYKQLLEQEEALRAQLEQDNEFTDDEKKGLDVQKAQQKNKIPK